MFEVLFIIGGEWHLEADVLSVDEREQLLLLENRGIHHVFEISLCESSVPVVDNVAAVHDLPENVDEIFERYL